MIAVIAALLVLAVALTCFYTVDDKQQAVVTTFGKVTDVTEAGVHFKLPLGIQKVEKVVVLSSLLEHLKKLAKLINLIQVTI